MMRSTMAPALPKKIAGLRYLSERLWQAMAMTTALSPERRTLAIMIFHSAAQNTADERSGKTQTIRSLPRRPHHSPPRGAVNPQALPRAGERNMNIAARHAISHDRGGAVMASSAGYNKM